MGVSVDYLSAYRHALQTSLNSVDLAGIQTLIGWLEVTRSREGRIYTFGNGGSASTASHFCTDLGKGAVASHGVV